jgi:glycosyltransferase involved in cell wall biosynthesis
MKDFLGAADILLLPLTDIALDRARYPHKLSDYVAAGRPLVACDVGETGRLLRRFNFGVLAPPIAEGFAQKIAKVADTPEHWNEMGTQTRAAAENHFNWDVLVDALLKRLREVV